MTSPDGVSATIVVIQATNSPNLVVAPFPDIDVTADAGSEVVTVTSNVFWSILSAPTWVDISPTSGSMNGSFTITYEANIGAERSDTIVVSGGGLTCTITITQEAGTPPPALQPTIDSVTVTGSEVTIVVSGGLEDSTYVVHSVEDLTGAKATETLWTAGVTAQTATGVWDDVAGTYTVKVAKDGRQRFYRVVVDGVLTDNVGGYYTLELDVYPTTNYVANQFNQPGTRTVQFMPPTNARAVAANSLAALFNALPASAQVTVRTSSGAPTVTKLPVGWSFNADTTREIGRGKELSVKLPFGAPKQDLVVSGTLEDGDGSEWLFEAGEQTLACSSLPVGGTPLALGMGWKHRSAFAPMNSGFSVTDRVYRMIGGGFTPSTFIPTGWPANSVVNVGESFKFMPYTGTIDREWAQELVIDPDTFQLNILND